MATQNFQYAGTQGGGGVTPATRTFAVASGGTSTVSIGDIVVCSAGYAAKVADGGMASTGKFGLAVSTSTDTASAAGSVDVMYCPAGLLVNGTLSTSASQSNVFAGFKIAVSAGVQKVDLGNSGVATLTAVGAPGTQSSIVANAVTLTQGLIALPWAV